VDVCLTLAENLCAQASVVDRRTRVLRSWQPSLSMRAGHPRYYKLATVPTFSFALFAVGPKIHWR